MADNLRTGLALWTEVRAAAKRCRAGQRKVAVAYVSDASTLSLGKNDVLVVNAGQNSMRQGSTTKDALLKYLSRGVRIFNRPDLHTKVMLFGDTVIIGSANMSLRAVNAKSLEAAVISTSKRLRRQVAEFIDELSSDLRPMSAQAIRALPDVDKAVAARVKEGPEVVDTPQRLWAFWHADVVLSAAEADDDRNAVAAVQARAKWTLRTSRRDPAAVGDLALPAWRDGDDVSFGPPARILGRYEGTRGVVLVLQDLEGCSALDASAEHTRRRAQLPREIRDLTLRSKADVLVTGKELEQVTRLFSDS